MDLDSRKLLVHGLWEQAGRSACCCILEPHSSCRNFISGCAWQQILGRKYLPEIEQAGQTGMWQGVVWHPERSSGQKEKDFLEERTEGQTVSDVEGEDIATGGILALEVKGFIGSS